MRHTLVTAAVLLIASSAAVAGPPDDGLRVQRSEAVSGPSPYGTCATAPGAGIEGSPALLPPVAGSGAHPDVVWQQDATHGGGPDIVTSSAGLGSTAGDLGVGRCTNLKGTDATVSAPSVVAGPDGTQWAVAMVFGTELAQVVLASRSRGAAWVSRVVSAFDPAGAPLSYLPPTVAVDPQDPRSVHVAYPRNHFPAGTLSVHRVSRDGGATWSSEHIIGVGPTPVGYDFAEQIVALGGQRLLAVSTEIDQADMVTLTPDYLAHGDLTQAPVMHRARTSTDGGTTWSLPVTVHDVANGGVRDREKGGTALRSLVRPSVAVGPDGAVHVAGESVVPDKGTEVLLSTSRDGGLTWSSTPGPEVVGVALAASVAVDETGRLAVSFLDLSGDAAGDSVLTAGWRIATRQGTVWRTQPLGDDFDLRPLKPVAVGDQGALLGLRRGFAAATVVGTGVAGNPSDVVLTVLR